MSTFRFLCFGSGSSGNCFYFQNDEGAFLIDAGIGIRKLLRYFPQYGINPQSVKAIFLTHDHIDHVRCASMFSSKYKIPVYATEGVWSGIDGNPVISKKVELSYRHQLEKNQSETICGCQLIPFTVPHDSKDNVGYLISYGDVCLAHVTDAGKITEEIESHISKANRLIIEANYDEEMLLKGPYPAFLKKRVASDVGHLSNKGAAQTILHHYQHISHVWLCHLSENNNTPNKSLETVQNLLCSSGVAADNMPQVSPLNRTLPTGFFDL